MARKAQGTYTQVSALVGRIELSVSGKAWTDKQGIVHPEIPKVEGLIAEISFESESDKMYHALCSSRVTAQSTLKDYFWQHGRLPVTPGKVFKITSDGKMDLPNTFYVDKIAAKAADGGLDAGELERLKAIIAMAEAKMAAQPVLTHEEDDSVEDSTEPVLRYNVEELRNASTQKLRQLAQDGSIDGYATKPRNALVDALAVVLK